MTVFWVVALILVVCAAGFALWPLWRPASETLSEQAQKSQHLQEFEERKRQNLVIFKDRVAELEHELSLNLIDASQFEALKSELELSLLADLDIALEDGQTTSGALSAQSPNVPANKPILLSLVVLLSLSALSYAAYFQWGAYDKQQQFLATRFAPQELDAAQQAAESGDIESLISQLYNKLQNAPDNIEGWTLLARTAMNVQKFDLAIESYQKVALSLERSAQSSAPVYGLIAQAEYLKAGARMSAATQAALDKALDKNPIESNALGLMAVSAFEVGDFEQAIKHWQALLDNYPEHPARAQISDGIARAKRLRVESSGVLAPLESSAEPAPENTESAKVATGKANIKLRVSLDPALQAQVDASDSVFIFARASSGPPMPLAASRHKASELPLELELNDSMAMTPTAKLSSVAQVRVVARVSKSGQPMAQSGDLFAEQLNVPVEGANLVELTINQVKP